MLIYQQHFDQNDYYHYDNDYYYIHEQAIVRLGLIKRAYYKSFEPACSFIFQGDPQVAGCRIRAHRIGL